MGLLWLLPTLLLSAVLAVHVAGALLSLLLGAVLLWGRKGSLNHRVLGWTWVAAMGITALTSIGLGGGAIPHIAGFSPIHVFTVVVLASLPLGVAYARRRQVAGHRQVMISLYVGGCLVAGAFTLLPGRLLGRALFG